VVTVELQLRPPPPKDSHPWFWGAGMLDFLRDSEVVWRAELPLSARDRSAQVEHRGEFGWVLVLRFTHEGAERLLAGLDLPRHVEGELAPKPGLRPLRLDRP
jgi:hypothetical protein